VIERWITAGATAAKISRVEPRDDTPAGAFSLDVDFQAAFTEVLIVVGVR
jgi:hypothetical protein